MLVLGGNCWFLQGTVLIPSPSPAILRQIKRFAEAERSAASLAQPGALVRLGRGGKDAAPRRNAPSHPTPRGVQTTLRAVISVTVSYSAAQCLHHIMRSEFDS